MTSKNLDAERAVVKWLESFVVELNLCPFAKPVLRTQALTLQTISGGTETTLTAVAKECERLDTNPQIETSLLILESGFSNFDDYLDMLEIAETLLIDLGYRGVYQIASFHPEYVFAGTSPEDPENYTNRSPFPLIHLLRESSITRALATYHNPEQIPERNRSTMCRFDEETLRKRLGKCLL